MNEFMRRLNYAKNNRSLNQNELAKAVGVSQQAVAKWLAGESMPARENIAPLARCLGVSPEWLEFGAGSGPDQVANLAIAEPVVSFGRMLAEACAEYERLELQERELFRRKRENSRRIETMLADRVADGAAAFGWSALPNTDADLVLARDGEMTTVDVKATPIRPPTSKVDSDLPQLLRLSPGSPVADWYVWPVDVGDLTPAVLVVPSHLIGGFRHLYIAWDDPRNPVVRTDKGDLPLRDFCNRFDLEPHSPDPK